MADKKITDFTSLTEATISAANDVLVIVDATGPETKKATVSAIVGAGLLAGVGEANIDNIEINGNAIISTDTNGNIDLTPNGSGEVNISKVDIDSGTIDNTVIGGSTPAAATFSTADINGGTIDGATIGSASAAAGTFTNLTASGTVSFSGATVSDGGSVTTVDINGGTIDGATIGGSTAGAGTFTSAVVNGSGGLGYATGSGGTVTQITSRTTNVTLNKTNGAITLVSAAGTTSWQTFTVINNTVAATDTVIVSQKSGTDLNMIHVTAVATGSFNISFATTGGTTTEQPVFNFAVIKAVTA